MSHSAGRAELTTYEMNEWEWESASQQSCVGFVYVLVEDKSQPAPVAPPGHVSRTLT